MQRHIATMPPIKLMVVKMSLTPNIDFFGIARSRVSAVSPERADSLIATILGDTTQRLRRSRARRRLLELRDVFELVELAARVRRERERVDDRAVECEPELRSDAQDVRVVDLARELRVFRGRAARSVDALELVRGDRHAHAGPAAENAKGLVVGLDGAADELGRAQVVNVSRV